MSSNNYGGTRMEEWQRALKSHSDEEQEAQYDDKTTIRRGYSKAIPHRKDPSRNAGNVI